MKLAIITDVHADVHALTDALASIDRMGCDQIVCAGDLVDYGLFPDEVLDLLQARAIPTIRGNHDRWAVSSDNHHGGGQELSDASLRFLRGLPLSWNRLIEGVRVEMHHGRPRRDMEGIYPDRLSREEAMKLLDKADTDVLIVGHTHIAFRVEVRNRGVIVNPGALLRDPAHQLDSIMLLDPATGTFVPGPSPTPGTFGVLDLPSLEFRVYTAKGEERPALTRVL